MLVTCWQVGPVPFSEVQDLPPSRETQMTEQDVEFIVQRAREKFPGETPRIISDNGPQFIAKDASTTNHTRRSTASVKPSTWPHSVARSPWKTSCGTSGTSLPCEVPALSVAGRVRCTMIPAKGTSTCTALVPVQQFTTDEVFRSSGFHGSESESGRSTVVWGDASETWNTYVTGYSNPHLAHVRWSMEMLKSLAWPVNASPLERIMQVKHYMLAASIRRLLVSSGPRFRGAPRGTPRVCGKIPL